MQIGLTVPQFGDLACRAVLTDFARRAEASGFDGLAVFERLIYPIEPMTPFHATADGRLPPHMRRVFEPLTTLAFLAACTQRLSLVTGVMIAAYRSPVVLAKMAATLDQLCEGRLVLGLGLGWSEDEYVAAGVDFARRGERFDEYLRMLDAVWRAEGEIAFDGEFYRLPKALVEPRPFHTPRPPILVGGASEAALRRAALLADGWYASGFMPLGAMEERIATLRRTAEEAGRARPVVAAWLPVAFQDEPSDLPCVGDAARVVEGLARYRSLGVDHVFLSPLHPVRHVTQARAFVDRLALEVLPEARDAA